MSLEAYLHLKLDGEILTPSSPSYTSAIHRPNQLNALHASFVGLPCSFEDVTKLITFARKNGLEIAIKGGGWNMSGAGWSSSEGGMVIDLKDLREVRIEDEKSVVVVQGGATWGDVYQVASEAKLDVVGGGVAAVGVGGFLTGSGNSTLSPLRGLGVDNIVSMKVALADGSIVSANTEENEDLFWAIKGVLSLQDRKAVDLFSDHTVLVAHVGGGSRFGIVLEFVLKAYPTLGEVTVGALIFPGTAFGEFVPALQVNLIHPMALVSTHDIVQKCISSSDVQDRFIVAFGRAPPDFYVSIHFVSLNYSARLTWVFVHTAF